MAKHELNKVNINVEFEETANRQQLSSGDNIKTLFGKIKKFFTDLKEVAFTGSYNDLSDKPDIPAYDVVSKTANGLAPKLPNETSTAKYLRQDGTWVAPPNTTYTAASAVPKVIGNVCNTGTSIKYAREDHVHAAFNSDGHHEFVNFLSIPNGECVKKILTFSMFSSWMKTGYFNIKIVSEEQWNPIYIFDGCIRYGEIKISSIVSLNIDSLFRIGIRKVDMKTFELYIESNTIESEVYVYGDIFAPDVPSMTYTISDETITDTNVLSQITFYSVSADGITIMNYLNTSNIYPIDTGQADIGASPSRYRMLYLTSSPNISSDRNVKTDIHPISDKFVELFNKLTPVSFQFIDGNSGRTHIGFISQDVEQAMTEVGLTDIDFAGFCKDKMTKTIKKHIPLYDESGIPVLDKNENPVIKTITEVVDEVDDEGNIKYFYSLRYEEFIALNTAVIQRQQLKIDCLEERVRRIEESIEL